MTSRLEAFVPYAVLAALLMLNVFLKVRHSVSLPRFDPLDETGYFKVESAFQYRYARLAALGQAAPEIDAAAQYPEGVRAPRELTLWMTYATGWTYRYWPWTRRPDFHWFVILWVASVSSLSLLAFWALARRLTGDVGLALAATAVYGLSWAAISDLIGTYGFQCFALPLLYAGMAFLAASLDREEPRPVFAAYLSGASFFSALASWHVSRFILASCFAALAYACWRLRKDEDFRRRLRRSLSVILGFAAAAALLVPSLRESRLLLSPTLCLGYALLAYLSLSPRGFLIFLTVLGASFWGFNQVLPESAAYGHAYAMLLEKIKFLLTKPDDPLKLNWEARMLWVGPFNSPETGFLLFSLLPLSAVVVPRLLTIRASPDRTPRPIELITDAMAAMYLIGTILVVRLMPVFAFFLCLWGIRNLASATLSRKHLWTAVLAALAVLEGLKSFIPHSPLNPFMRLSAAWVRVGRQPPLSFTNERKLYYWLRENAAGKPVLAHYGISGPILAYTSSPVLLNPKGESLSSRRKSYDYLLALYSDEKAFSDYCRVHGASYYVHHIGSVLDETKDSSRYDAGRTFLRTTDAAVLFHFHPEKLRHFRLVFENPDYRVYAVGAQGSSPPTVAPRQAIYELARFNPKITPEGTLQLDIAPALELIRQSHQRLFRARLLARLGRREQALAEYEKAFAAWPPDDSARAEADDLVLRR